MSSRFVGEAYGGAERDHKGEYGTIPNSSHNLLEILGQNLLPNDETQE